MEPAPASRWRDQAPSSPSSHQRQVEAIRGRVHELTLQDRDQQREGLPPPHLRSSASDAAAAATEAAAAAAGEALLGPWPPAAELLAAEAAELCPSGLLAGGARLAAEHSSAGPAAAEATLQAAAAAAAVGDAGAAQGCAERLTGLHAYPGSLPHERQQQQPRRQAPTCPPSSSASPPASATAAAAPPAARSVWPPRPRDQEEPQQQPSSAQHAGATGKRPAEWEPPLPPRSDPKQSAAAVAAAAEEDEEEEEQQQQQQHQHQQQDGPAAAAGTGPSSTAASAGASAPVAVPQRRPTPPLYSSGAGLSPYSPFSCQCVQQQRPEISPASSPTSPALPMEAGHVLLQQQQQQRLGAGEDVAMTGSSGAAADSDADELPAGLHCSQMGLVRFEEVEMGGEQHSEAQYAGGRLQRPPAPGRR
jgi:hypothetical protein